VNNDTEVKAQATGLDGDTPSTKGIIECGRPELPDPSLAQTWQFSDGAWTQLDGDPLGPNNRLDEATEEAGYLPVFRRAVDDPDPVFTLLAAARPTPTTARYRYLAWLDLPSGTDLLCLPTVADLLTISPMLLAIAELAEHLSPWRSHRAAGGRRSGRAA
jgi:hypothetical protein